MHPLLKKIRDKARANPKKIVFPESSEERILRAVEIISREKLAKVILLGRAEEIVAKIDKLRLKIKDIEITANFTSIVFHGRLRYLKE